MQLALGVALAVTSWSVLWFSASAEDTVTVITKHGQLQGQLVNDGPDEYMRFLGVPYAKPPVGELRFEEPQSLDEWTGTWIANRTSKCLQIQPDLRIEGQEDCLHLNIFVPGNSIDTSRQLAVLVRIDGGGFMYDTSSNNGGGGGGGGEKMLMSKEIILVSCNYRFGVFGFLSSGDRAMPGNNGLRDQTMALRWIKDNIDRFGGNPRSVTIAGFSAGAASVHFHQLSPQSSGLFHRAVSYSGVALNPWALQDQPLGKLQTVASYAGCTNDDNYLVKRCLKERNAYEILDATNLLRKFHFNPFAPLGPLWDKWAADPFLPQHPFDALREKKLINHVPWMTSMTTCEGLFPGAAFAADNFTLLTDLDKRWTEVVQHVLHFEETVHPLMQKTIAEAIKKKYFGNKNLSRKNFKKFLKLLSDRLFLSDFDTAIRLQSYASSEPVYIYQYNYSAEDAYSLAFAMQGNKKRYGVAHGDDVFLTTALDPQSGQLSTKPQDLEMADFLINMLVSFAKFGDPGIEQWQPMTRADEIKFLKIDAAQNVRMQSVAEFGRSEYWRRMMFEENEYHDIDLQGIGTDDDDDQVQKVQVPLPGTFEDVVIASKKVPIININSTAGRRDEL